MKKTLTTSQAAHLLLQDQNANWSYHGANALIEFIEEMDEACETETEMDVVALRCDFTEYESIAEAIAEYDFDEHERYEEHELEDAQREWLQDRTILLEFEGGVIIQNF